jgi:hypothetical protein
MLTETESSMVEAHRQGREAYKSWMAGTELFQPAIRAFVRDRGAQEAIRTLSIVAGLTTVEEHDAFRAGFLGSMRRHTQTGKVDP